MKKILLIVLLELFISTTPAQVSQTVQITNFNFDSVNPSLIRSPDQVLSGAAFLFEAHRSDSSLILIGNYNNDEDEFTTRQEFLPLSPLNINPVGTLLDWDIIQIFYQSYRSDNWEIVTRRLENNTWSDEILLTDSPEDEIDCSLVLDSSPWYGLSASSAIVYQSDSSIYLTEIFRDSIKTSLVFEDNILGSFSSPDAVYNSSDGLIYLVCLLTDINNQSHIVYKKRDSYNADWGFVTSVIDTGKIYDLKFIENYESDLSFEADLGGGRTTYIFEDWLNNDYFYSIEDLSFGEITRIQTDIPYIIGSTKSTDLLTSGVYSYTLKRNDSHFVRTNYWEFAQTWDDSLVATKIVNPRSSIGSVGFEYNGERFYTIWEDSANGYINLFGKKHVIPVGAVKDEKIVTGFLLEQNYPNPFNPTTKIKYTIPSVTLSLSKGDIFVALRVFDILGNEVATLVNENKPAGSYEVEFNVGQTSSLSSGVYYYQLRAGDFVETKKMILLR